MKTTLSLIGRQRTEATVRRELLAQFKQSGVSGAAFAREHGIAYSTFCAWRRRERAAAAVRFAEVEWVGKAAEVDLVIELGRKARMRVSSPEQVGLAAALLQRWEATC